MCIERLSLFFFRCRLSSMGNCNSCVQQAQPENSTRTGILPSSSSSFDNLPRSSQRNRWIHVRAYPSYHLNALIDETLLIIRTVADTDQEPPHAMLVVSRIANREDRWLEVMVALIERVPMDDPLGATVIALLLDECSLPSKELLQQLIRRICSDNRSKMKILESIIDEHSKQIAKQSENRAISSSIQTHVGRVTNLSDNDEWIDVNEITPAVINQEQQSHEK